METKLNKAINKALERELRIATARTFADLAVSMASGDSLRQATRRQYAETGGVGASVAAEKAGPYAGRRKRRGAGGNHRTKKGAA